MNKFLSESHFKPNKRQRNGIFFLLMTIVMLQGIYHFVDFSSDTTSQFSDEEMRAFKKQYDSLVALNTLNSRFRPYFFNPNYLTDYSGYKWGMSTQEIDKLLTFRASNKFLKSADQFKRITGLRDSVYSKMKPYIKFPDRYIEPTANSSKSGHLKVSTSDLNKATSSDFVLIEGVNLRLASRIVKYRSRLKGFSEASQLYEVYEMDSIVALRILKTFEIVSKPTIVRLNINEASFKEVLSLPYTDYNLTKMIFEFRDKVGRIDSISALKKIDGFPLDKLNRIALYLGAK